MCPNDASDRRRRHQDSTNHDPNKVSIAGIYATEISASADGYAHAAPPNGGIIRSSTARAVLAISTVVMLLLSFLGYGSNGAPNLKDLSDTVMNLTLQLHKYNLGETKTNNEDKIRRQLEEIEHQLDEKKIELEWEKQHVENQQMAQEILFQTMAGQIEKDQKVIEETEQVFHDVGHKAEKLYIDLGKEQEENAELKAALKAALDELSKEREKLPAPPLPPGEKVEKEKDGGSDDRNKHKLRAVPPPAREGYQPGDSIEIIEYQEGGKIALRPGIISDIPPDGTYTLVKLEQSLLLRDMKRNQFQTYHPYHEGMQAFFEEGKEQYAPVTIVKFIQGSAHKGFELHGSYQFILDRDPNGVIREGKAMRMHRFASIGEIVGAGSLSDRHGTA